MHFFDYEMPGIPTCSVDIGLESKLVWEVDQLGVDFLNFTFTVDTGRQKLVNILENVKNKAKISKELVFN